MVPARILIFVGLICLVVDTARSQSRDEVSHHVSFPGLRQQYVTVRSEFPVNGFSETLKMPVWTPGSYLVREFARNLDSITVTDSTGAPLEVSKVAKDRWQVILNGQDYIVAEYQVFAGELSVNTSWASTDYVLLNGASIFLYTDGSRDLAQRLQLEKPDELQSTWSAMESPGPNLFLAANYDELVDSPVVIANARVHSFSEDGQQYRLVNVGKGPFWDGPRSAEDVRSIVHAQNEFWGTLPFERPYWFFNFLVEQGAGLEHDHSTVISSSRMQMLKRDDYIKWLSLVSHEYFHAWNIRRMRPQALSRYNYQAEQYTATLWLAEGITSYYDNLLLSRARVIKPSEYFKRLALDIHAVENVPGRKALSLDQASMDTWIRQYRPQANSINSTISYYTKGAVLGLVLDTELRMRTNSRVSLDDVIRRLYRRWSAKPYPESAFPDAVEEIGGDEVREWLEPLISSTAELDVDRALAWYGLILNRHPVNNAARDKGEPLEAGLGINFEPDPTRVVVSSVSHGMGASNAGILPADELIAVEGERITPDTLHDRMARLRPGMTVELLVARRGRIMNIPVVLDESRSATYEVLVDPEFGKTELRRLEDWLGQQLAEQD